MNPPTTPSVAPPSTPYRPLLWLAVAAGLGVAVDYNIGLVYNRRSLQAWWLAAVAVLSLAQWARRRNRSRLAAFSLMLSTAALGGACHHWRWNQFPSNDLARFANESPQPACVEVVLAERVKISPPPDRSPLRAIPARTFSEATVQVLAIRDGRRWRSAGGQSRLRVAGAVYDLKQGDRLQLFAQLARPASPLNPGEYDWSAVERRQGRLSELYCADPNCITVQQPARRLGITAALRAVRTWCEQELASSVDSADVPLVLATLLGDQERLSDSTKDAFLKTGSIHLLVVSGAHVALLASLAWQIARGVSLSRHLQLLLTGGAVIVYAAIVGPQPSVMRATMLTLATFAALTRGRSISAGNLLGAAALVVMAYNPCELFRSGTQFSFLAVAVLIAFGKWAGRHRQPTPLERLIDEARPWIVRAARSVATWFLIMTAASLAVGVAMTPLVAYHFNVVTPASIVLTPIAGPLIAMALASGVGVVTLGSLIPPLGAALGAVCGGCLHAAEWIVLRAEYVPGSYFYTPGLPAWWLWAFYGSIGLIAAMPRLRPDVHWMTFAGLAWLAVGYASAGPGPLTKGELRCTFLSVGHGTCVVLQLPSGQTLLYDAGSLGSPEAAAKTIAAFLWSRGIDRIDALVLSHADIDHYNAVPGLLERFPVDAVYISPMMFDPIAADGELTAPNYLREVVNLAQIPLREVWMGDRLATADDSVSVEILHPPREGVFGRDNANSLLVSLEFAGKRILLPGDLETPGIEMVMADPPLDCDVLLAPHHGSGGSDPPGFAAWCTPELVVMSGSEPDRTELAQRSYTQAGAAVLHTAPRGAVEVRISEGNVEVSTFK